MSLEGRLKGALNKNYGRADLDKNRLGELIDLNGSIQLADVAARSKDVLRRVFECFLGQFASAEGKKGGQFYTPSCVVRLLVEMLAPDKGRVYDPCCRSGGMFLQSERFVDAHGGRLGDISIYGQENNPTSRRLLRVEAAWPASCWPTAACPPTSPAKATSAHAKWRPTSWTA